MSARENILGNELFGRSKRLIIGFVMAAENEQNEGQGLGAPAALVEGLRRLDRQVIFVTRQMDETILSRPRVHLARTRELRKGHGRMVGVAEEELALAARTAAPQHAGRSEFGVAET